MSHAYKCRGTFKIPHLWLSHPTRRRNATFRLAHMRKSHFETRLGAGSIDARTMRTIGRPVCKFMDYEYFQIGGLLYFNVKNVCETYERSYLTFVQYNWPLVKDIRQTFPRSPLHYLNRLYDNNIFVHPYMYLVFVATLNSTAYEQVADVVARLPLSKVPSRLFVRRQFSLLTRLDYLCVDVANLKVFDIRLYEIWQQHQIEKAREEMIWGTHSKRNKEACYPSLTVLINLAAAHRLPSLTQLISEHIQGIRNDDAFDKITKWYYRPIVYAVAPKREHVCQPPPKNLQARRKIHG